MENIKYPEFIEEFKSYMIGIKNLSANYIENIISTLKDFLEFVNDHIFDCKYESINDMTLNEIRFLNNSDIYGYIYYLVKNNNQIGTRLKKIEHLRAFFDYLYRIKNKLFKEPFKQIKRQKNEYKHLPNYLSLTEAKNLLNNFANKKDNFKNLRNYTIVSLFLNSGLRISELVNLKISDINLVNNTFLINGKGNKERTGYLNEEAKNILLKYLNLRNEIICPDKETSKYLFISTRKKKICDRQVRRIIKNGYIDCGIENDNYSVHTLRHTFATILYKSGTDIKILKELLGHSRIETTQIYTHLHNESVMRTMQEHPLSKFKMNDALAFAS